MGDCFWRYGRACEFVVRAKKGDKSGLPQARKLLGEVSDRRPAWSRVALCEAETWQHPLPLILVWDN